MKNAIPSNYSLLSRCDKDNKIIFFLKAVPHLKYTAKGITKIAHRLKISPAYLLLLINFTGKEGCQYGN